MCSYHCLNSFYKIYILLVFFSFYPTYIFMPSLMFIRNRLFLYPTRNLLFTVLLPLTVKTKKTILSLELSNIFSWNYNKNILEHNRNVYTKIGPYLPYNLIILGRWLFILAIKRAFIIVLMASKKFTFYWFVFLPFNRKDIFMSCLLFIWNQLSCNYYKNILEENEICISCTFCSYLFIHCF